MILVAFFFFFFFFRSYIFVSSHFHSLNCRLEVIRQMAAGTDESEDDLDSELEDGMVEQFEKLFALCPMC